MQDNLEMNLNNTIAALDFVLKLRVFEGEKQKRNTMRIDPPESLPKVNLKEFAGAVMNLDSHIKKLTKE